MSEGKTRREFMSTSAAGAAAALLAGARVGAGQPGQGTPQFKVVSWNDAKMTDGQETDGTIEVTRGDGTTLTARVYYRKVDADATYVVFTRLVTPQKTITTIVNATKGPVEGDHRQDQLQITTLLPDGTVSRRPAFQAHVLTNHPYAGMPTQEQINQLFADQQAGRIE